LLDFLSGKTHTEDEKPKALEELVFDGLVGLVDMTGFSRLARGKSPEQVRDLAVPFVKKVVHAATAHHCFIDKVIGDEVMFVMPCFTRGNQVVEECGLPIRENPLPDLGPLLFDLVEGLELDLPHFYFTSGFAFGPVILSRIGDEEYSEWTVYGCTVNTAKRLQSLKQALPLPSRVFSAFRSGGAYPWRKHPYIVCVGALTTERPSFVNNLHDWVAQHGNEPRLILRDVEFGSKNLRGVGPTDYMAAGIATASTSA
jgi:hypothetical protein